MQLSILDPFNPLSAIVQLTVHDRGFEPRVQGAPWRGPHGRCNLKFDLYKVFYTTSSYSRSKSVYLLRYFGKDTPTLKELM